MLELIFKISIFAAITVVLISVLVNTPMFAELIVSTIDNYEVIIEYINQFANILQEYVTPWIGLLNNMLSPPTTTLLMTFLVWKMIKPLFFFYIDVIGGLARSILQKIG